MAETRQLPDDGVAPPDPRPPGSPERALGDFTATPNLLQIGLLAPPSSGRWSRWSRSASWT